MSKKIGRFYIVALLFRSWPDAPHALAQRTFGGLTGTITDDSGAIVPNATVMIVGDQTKLTRNVRHQRYRNLQLRESAHRQLHHHSNSHQAFRL